MMFSNGWRGRKELRGLDYLSCRNGYFDKLEIGLTTMDYLEVKDLEVTEQLNIKSDNKNAFTIRDSSDNYIFKVDAENKQTYLYTDLNIVGALNYIDTNVLNVADQYVMLTNNQTTLDAVDAGFLQKYNNSGVKYRGLIHDISDYRWKLIDECNDPDTQIAVWNTASLDVNELRAENYYKSGVLLNTSHVPESTNLYYTDTRARNAISSTNPITYNSSTGVIGFNSNVNVNVKELTVGPDFTGATMLVGNSASDKVSVFQSSGHLWLRPVNGNNVYINNTGNTYFNAAQNFSIDTNGNFTAGRGIMSDYLSVTRPGDGLILSLASTAGVHRNITYEPGILKDETYTTNKDTYVGTHIKRETNNHINHKVRTSIESEGAILQLVSTTHGYIEFYPDGPSTRKAWMGYGNSDSKNFSIINDISGGAVELHAGDKVLYVNSAGTTCTGNHVIAGTSFVNNPNLGTLQQLEYAGNPIHHYHYGSGLLYDTTFVATKYTYVDTIGLIKTETKDNTTIHNKLGIGANPKVDAVARFQSEGGAGWSGLTHFGSDSGNNVVVGGYNGAAWIGAHAADMKSWAPLVIDAGGAGVTCGGNVNVTGSLSAGTFSFTNLSVPGTLSVTGNTTLGNATVSGTLTNGRVPSNMGECNFVGFAYIPPGLGITISDKYCHFIKYANGTWIFDGHFRVTQTNSAGSPIYFEIILYPESVPNSVSSTKYSMQVTSTNGGGAGAGNLTTAGHHVAFTDRYRIHVDRHGAGMNIPQSANYALMFHLVIWP